MSTRLFVACTSEKATENWPMCSTGNSSVDENSWSVSTYHLHADEVPDACQDAKTTAALISGLLNAYYNDIDATKISEDALIEMGYAPKYESGYETPASHPELPF